MAQAQMKIQSTNSVSDRIAAWLGSIGVRWVFGVSGGGVAPLWGSLSRACGLRVVHCQHESGAAFCATEASLATGAPVVVFTTTGPGLTNALTGLCAAREEGARVLVLSAVTPTHRRYRGATQESGPSTVLASLFTGNSLFDVAATVEDTAMLPPLLQQIEAGLQSPGGFVGHLGLPTDLQGDRTTFGAVPVRIHAAKPDRTALAALATRLQAQRCAIVAGFGARDASGQLRTLAEALDAPVVVTPRGKGVFPAHHPLHAGVLGFAGHERALATLERHRPEIVLALGTELGEGSSQYTDVFDGCALVGIGPVRRVGALLPRGMERVEGSVGDVLDGLLVHLPKGAPRVLRPRPTLEPVDSVTVDSATVSPVALMAAVQRVCIDQTPTRLMAESGNSFAFAIHHLALDAPLLRVSVGWGSMGHFTTGVVGAALATGERVVALVGDGSMQMQHELLTAVHHEADATWVVLNDGGYGMCRQGTMMLGVEGVDCEVPDVDFAAWARALGVPARTVRNEAALDEALREGIRGRGPRLIDVRINPAVLAPLSGRVRQLTWSGDEVTR